MRQFYVHLDGDSPPRVGDIVALDSDESHHLTTVLRGGRSQILHLVDGRGHRLTGVPDGRDGKRALVRLDSVELDESELAAPRLQLACAVVKGKRFEWVLEKAVELGAWRITPLLTEHGVIEPGEGRRGRWSTLLQTALKQSGRACLPELGDPVSPAGILTGVCGEVACFGSVPSELDTGEPQPVSWRRLLPDPGAPLPPVLTLLIGPEGGWTPAERRLLLERGARPVSLGPHVLRTETAAIAGLALLQNLRQECLARGPSTTT